MSLSSGLLRVPHVPQANGYHFYEQSRQKIKNTCDDFNVPASTALHVLVYLFGIFYPILSQKALSGSFTYLHFCRLHWFTYSHGAASLKTFRTTDFRLIPLSARFSVMCLIISLKFLAWFIVSWHLPFFLFLIVSVVSMIHVFAYQYYSYVWKRTSLH